MADPISWVATVTTIVAAFMVAANLGSRVTGTGFLVFTVGSICWLAAGVLTHQQALIWTNVVLTGLNLFGMWRWLGRQAGVEKGARAATQASEQTPGEALFPVSLLSRAPVASGADELGRCIDAMAGCRSGKLDYLVVSEGGIAGVGETLRRLPWTDAHVEDERVVVRPSMRNLAALEELQRDQWPAR